MQHMQYFLAEKKLLTPSQQLSTPVRSAPSTFRTLGRTFAPLADIPQLLGAYRR